MTRVAIVSPRYGAEINGGAETLARMYAGALRGAGIDVTVLTTCALDYRTWADHFPPGESTDDGVRVLRFPVPVPRDEAAFDAFCPTVLRAPTPANQERWMDLQGPTSPGLLDHLASRGTEYDAVLFVPYLYATTVRGLPLVRDRSVLVPALHDEPWAALSIFDPVIGDARALVFSTPEERAFAERRFAVAPERCHLVGVGVDEPPAGDAERFRERYGVRRPYVIVVGRIDPSKGSLQLIDDHRRYRELRPEGVDLVMLGRAVVDLPTEPWLVTPGFVDDQTKHDAIAGAVALVAPSPYESLSLVLLEAWSHGVPTVATQASEVMVGQTRRASGGLWYRDADEYAAVLDLLVRRPALRSALGRSGWRFAREMRWETVTERLLDAVRQAAAEPASVH